MNSNVPMLNEFAGRNTAEVIRMLNETIRQQQAVIEKLNETVDKLLNHCDDPECWECGKIICPYGGEMHFHHDGCPTCAQMEAQENERK
jgi:hypothetical protein